MELLDSESGKRRLLTVDLPGIEKYNKDRDEAFTIRVAKTKKSLILKYRLKPGHNIYELETELPSTYPDTPPLTRVVTDLRSCPHLLAKQALCMWRQGSSRQANRWDPARFSCIFAIQAAWRWLACYEVWYTTGEWPIPEAE